MLSELAAARQPFVTSGCLEAWPARAHWGSLAYLDHVAGHRLVPAEVGAVVGGADWHEELIPFGQFLRSLLAPSCAHCANEVDAPLLYDGQIAYLAQHELLDQCPTLRNDIALPEAWREVFGHASRTNVWLGTHGTVTPCHWDSYDNCLAQVHGSKVVFLLAPEAKSYLYTDRAAGDTAAQGNLSPVNVEAPNLTEYPAFSQAQVYVCQLAPGDCLYIPEGWWHQVRALSPSFSVNFWF